MNEYSFVKVGVTEDGCNLQLPIHSISDLRFFIPDEANFLDLRICDLDHEILTMCDYDFADGFLAPKITDISTFGCFVLGIEYTSGILYTNIFRYVSDVAESILVKYLCFEEYAGFDYTIANSYNQIRLPITLIFPQYPQEEKIYIDGNGVRQLLMSKIDKEYTLETEYISDAWHENTVVMLGHDEVYYDGVKLQKTGAYEINYDEYDELSCGTRLYKAQAKLTKNTTIKNTNC